MKWTVRRHGESRRRHGDSRSWPGYLLGGRMRASTAGLIVAFIALFWVNQNYQPAPTATPPDQTQQVVPPGFVPDPNYTWVPRTNVQTTTPETTTTTTTTTSPTPTPTTTTTESTLEVTPTTTAPLLPGQPAPSTTVIDPDGPGPLPPQTFTQAPPGIFAPPVLVPPATVPPA